MISAEIIGNIGADATPKEINGKKYVSFSVAHTDKNRDQSVTTWVSVLMSGDGGRLLQYLTKGTRVFVRGRLSASVYTGNDGESRVGLTVYTTEVELLGGSKSDESKTI